jgi:hypothetical protein
MKSGGGTPDERIAWAFRVVMAHDPGTQRQKILTAAYSRFFANYSANRDAAGEFVHEGESPVPQQINSAELAAYTNVASIILNMDEAISKE